MVSEFKNLQDGISACTRCTVFRRMGYWKFPPEVHGNTSSDVWIMGSNPRRIDAELRRGETPRYWMGRSRQNLRDPIEHHFGRSLEEIVYLTDAVKCQTETGSIPAQALSTCPSAWLVDELKILRPKAILALGKDAERGLGDCEDALTGIGAEVIQLPHPSPANVRKIRATYGGRGWSAYKSYVVDTLEDWLGQ